MSLISDTFQTKKALLYQAITALTQYRSNLSICRDTISQNNIASNRILSLYTPVARVSFHGVYKAVINLFNNPRVVRQPILRTSRTIGVIPIEENDHPGCRLYSSICPLAAFFEPVHAMYTAGVFRYNSVLDVSALISAPGNEACAPFYV